MSAEAYASTVDEVNRHLRDESLRAYFVSGAIRLHLAQKRLSLLQALSTTPTPRADLEPVLPPPHTMLYHPSARLDLQFEGAEELSKWSRDPASVDATEPLRDEQGRLKLDGNGLKARLAAEEPAWRRWMSEFRATAEALSLMAGGAYPSVEDQNWPDIRRLLEDEVFPNVRLAIVNSDPRADDRPRFDAIQLDNGLWLPPRDIFTIFVSGNVMSRGLTLEGLCTTLFVRPHNEPAADTQMQMQRWFGYRGKQLPWCRVFLYQGQLALFRAYHENDEALRWEVIRAMNATPGQAPNPLVLQGSTFVATRKLSNLSNLPLHPGATPFVRAAETANPNTAKANADVLADLLDQSPSGWEEVVVSGTSRGWIRTAPIGLVDVANLLERFVYSDHDPDKDELQNQRWRHLEGQIGLSPPTAPLFRPPQRNPDRPTRVSPKACPYSIAAYLRLWDAVLSRRARGLVPTDRPDLPWSMLDLEAYNRTRPLFYLGIRNGSAGLSTHGRLASHGVRSMTRQVGQGYVESTWGSRNDTVDPDGYLGDQFFDYHFHHAPFPNIASGEPAWRPRGAPGLVLFHVIRNPEVGSTDIVTVGLALPHGGPDHFAALRALQRPPAQQS